MNDIKVIKNQYGYYELLNKPSDVELERYYKNVYYQESKSSYSKSYDEKEIQYFINKYAQKYNVLLEHNILSNGNRAFLDVGCVGDWTFLTQRDGMLLASIILNTGALLTIKKCFHLL